MGRASAVILVAVVVVAAVFTTALFVALRGHDSPETQTTDLKPSPTQNQGRESPDTQSADITLVPTPMLPQLTVVYVDLSLSELRSFADFPVYWVGEEFLGYPLDRIIGPHPDSYNDPVLVVYGTCGEEFETGCSPPLVIKTKDDCVREAGQPVTLGQRTAARSGQHLVAQAGEVAVTIYASPELQAAAAQEMVVANAEVFTELEDVTPGSPLPEPPDWLAAKVWKCVPSQGLPAPAPATPEPGEPSRVATVFAAFGEAAIPITFEEAETMLGWRVLRSDDPRFTLQDPGVGLIRVFKNPLPRLEQIRYSMIGHSYPIHMGQEPESYPDTVADNVTIWPETVAGWVGQFETGTDWVQFVFFSGESVDGQRIRVWVSGREEYSPDEIRAFVESLRFGP